MPAAVFEDELLEDRGVGIVHPLSPQDDNIIDFDGSFDDITSLTLCCAEAASLPSRRDGGLDPQMFRWTVDKRLSSAMRALTRI